MTTTIWTVDVWYSTSFPVSEATTDRQRVIVSADNPTEAELTACQVVARLGTPTRSSIIEVERGMSIETTTTVHRAAFPSLDEALTFVRDRVDGVGGSTVQLLVGSSAWPDPARRFRVTVSVEQ